MLLRHRVVLIHEHFKQSEVMTTAVFAPAAEGNQKGAIVCVGRRELANAVGFLYPPLDASHVKPAPCVGVVYSHRQVVPM